jgi:glycosyltransferase involved in cell wall biosynthesis
MTEPNTNPLVSVVLPTYNRPESLPDSIESVTNQTYKRIELIVVDDHSDTSQQNTVNSVSHEGLHDMIFVRHNENRGLSAARNTGIKRASGQLVAFLDDDDVWKADKIERQVGVFRRAGSEVGAVCTGIRSIDASGSVISVRSIEPEGDITKDLLYDTVVSVPTLLVRRSVIADAGLFDERLKVYEDREWVIRLSQHCKFRSIRDPLLVTQRDEDHESLTPDLETRKEVSHPILLETCRMVAAEYGFVAERKTVAYATFDLGDIALRQGEYREAQKSILRAILLWPFVLKFYPYMLAAALGNRGYKTARKAKRAVVGYWHKINI